MATLQFTFTDSSTLFRPSLPSSSRAFSRNRSLIVKASSSSDDFSRTRRRFIAETAAISVSLPLFPAKAEDSLSEWERVYLPIDPGVVLLDIAFVPDDPNHGFLLGTRQTILETKDGGNTWAPRSIPSAEDEDFNYRFNSISFKGKEGWIVGKPAILLYTSDAGESWERIPLSAELPGDMVYIKATGEKSAEMVTDQGAIYVTANRGYNWRAAVQETVSATLNRTVSSGISGASYYTGTFNTVNRSPDGRYVAVSSRGNFYLTWEPGQPFWQPHNRAVARRIQNMGWRADGGLWLLVRGGGLYLSKGSGVSNSKNVILVYEYETNSLPFHFLPTSFRIIFLAIFLSLKLSLNFVTLFTGMLPYLCFTFTYCFTYSPLFINKETSIFDQASFLHSVSLCLSHIHFGMPVSAKCMFRNRLSSENKLNQTCTAFFILIRVPNFTSQNF